MHDSLYIQLFYFILFSLRTHITTSQNIYLWKQFRINMSDMNQVNNINKYEYVRRQITIQRVLNCSRSMLLLRIWLCETEVCLLHPRLPSQMARVNPVSYACSINRHISNKLQQAVGVLSTSRSPCTYLPSTCSTSSISVFAPKPSKHIRIC